MKKSVPLLVWLALASSLSFADTAATPEGTSSGASNAPLQPIPSTSSSTANTPAAAIETPAAATDAPAKLTETPAPTEAPQAAAPKSPIPIDCTYKVPKDMVNLDPSLIKIWAEHAAIQSFQFDPANLKSELAALKSCYTEQGWKAFNEALQTSGNLDAIESNKLKVTSKIRGASKVQDVKEKQWKVSIPMDVNYQNKEKQLLQSLNVDLLISVQKSGLLGIMQVIAVPEQATDKKSS